MDKLEANEILNRIIDKGGLLAQCGKLYMDDPEKATQFIKECSEQCHNKSAVDQWGEMLVSDIKKFSNNPEIN